MASTTVPQRSTLGAGLQCDERSRQGGERVRFSEISVGTMTLCLIAVKTFVDLHHVSSAYLIPVLIAAIRLGLVPALVVAIGGVGASAFFFYPPIYDFRVHNPEQLLDLPLFVVVTMVTSQLAVRAQVHARSAREHEAEMRALYALPSPLPRRNPWVLMSLDFPRGGSLPCNSARSASALDFSGPAQRSIVTACKLAESLDDPLHRGLRRSRRLLRRHNCYRLERPLPGGIVSH